VFRLAYRQAEGLLGSIVSLLGLGLRVPDHTTLSRRAATLDVPRPGNADAGAGSEPMHLLVDSTGLKLCGKGEWLLEKHGTATRRSWRALHLGVDAGTGRIVACTLTRKDVDDASQAGPLLDQVAGAVASFTGDGAYDRDRVYASVAERHPDAAVVVPPRTSAVPSDTAETAPTQRDGHLQHIAEHGRMAWQNASGYNRCARVEATMNRWKQVIGDELRAHTDERQATEVAVAVHALNRMLDPALCSRTAGWGVAGRDGPARLADHMPGPGPGAAGRLGQPGPPGRSRHRPAGCRPLHRHPAGLRRRSCLGCL